VRASPAPIQLSPQAETPVFHEGAEPSDFSRVDWVGAFDVSHFVGREVEVAELTQWIVQERCRVVTLLGMGGIGKSALVSFLGQHVAPQFEAVLWRSVLDAPRARIWSPTASPSSPRRRQPHYRIASPGIGSSPLW
jgi:hypothetical protein